MKKYEAQLLTDTLTRRELEVLRYVIAGCPNKVIAYEMRAAEKTIKVHRRRMRDKLRIHNVADLVRFAQLAGVEPAKLNSEND